MEYSQNKIDKDIPLPNPRQNQASAWPFNRMDVGDSTLIVAEYSRQFHNLVANSARSMGRRHDPPWGFTVRKQEGGVRVWRIK